MSEFVQWLITFVVFFGALGAVVFWDALAGRRERKAREQADKETQNG